MDIKSRKVPVEKLKKKCESDIFDFKTTQEVEAKYEMIKQKRVEKALDFGLGVKSEGFNLFVSGPSGTGRNTAVMRKVKEIAKNEPVPDDICYLYNFQKPDEPKVVTLPASKGCKFREDMENCIKEIETEIRKSFESKEYESHKRETLKHFEEQKKALSQELEEFAKSKGFTLQQTITGIAVVPVYKGKPLKDKDYEKLSEKEKNQINERQSEVQQKLEDYLRKVRNIERKAKQEIKELDKKIALYSIGHLIDEIKQKYKEFPIIEEHLESIKKDITNNVNNLKKEEDRSPFPFMPAVNQKKKILNKYKVNLLVDNCELKGAPVVVENNPTYYNLVGKIEYSQTLGMMTTDFTMIKPGAIHRANGGYLIIQALDILKDYFAWEALKRIIKHKKVKIEDINERFRLISIKSLKPQPLPIDLKIIMVGLPLIYHLLYIYDKDFKKLFKVKADFDTKLDRSNERIKEYTTFIASKCKEENLNHFNSEAVATLIEHSSRLTEHKQKLSAKFSEILTVIREASYWSKKDNSKIVEAKHVKKAINEKIYRSNMIEEKIQEMIDENTLLIDTEGKKIGQINGISILDLGDYMFGKPSRITARTFVGKGDLVNIEREAKLSGNIHSKGVLILKGYLGEKFAQDKPLALSVSICFEQLYEEIEGDSASSAELYCILSSLTETPLAQNIAVTGSVNQKGEIQPVGAINEKIEGFYKTCKLKGLNGSQGIIIPKDNEKHLMLRDEVIKAVEEGAFHIYSIKTIEEGIEILTGIEAGKKDKQGKYPKDTIFYRANQKLAKYAKLAKETKK